MLTRSDKMKRNKDEKIKEAIAMGYRIGMADAKKEPNDRFLNLETLDTWKDTLFEAYMQALR